MDYMNHSRNMPQEAGQNTWLKNVGQGPWTRCWRSSVEPPTGRKNTHLRLDEERHSRATLALAQIQHYAWLFCQYIQLPHGTMPSAYSRCRCKLCRDLWHRRGVVTASTSPLGHMNKDPHEKRVHIRWRTRSPCASARRLGRRRTMVLLENRETLATFVRGEEKEWIGFSLSTIKNQDILVMDSNGISLIVFCQKWHSWICFVRSSPEGLGDAVTTGNEQSCPIYNMPEVIYFFMTIKLTFHLKNQRAKEFMQASRNQFRWTNEILLWLDERALINGVLIWSFMLPWKIKDGKLAKMGIRFGAVMGLLSKHFFVSELAIYLERKAAQQECLIM